MTRVPISPNECALLDELIQDFQGVMLTIHAACQSMAAHDPVRGALEVSLDRADLVLARWRDRVRFRGGSNTGLGKRR
jgi:hypothetical protein